MHSIYIGHFNLEVNTTTKRSVQRFDVPASAVLLLKHQLGTSKLDIGKWRLLSSEPNRETDSGIEAQRRINVSYCKFWDQRAPVRRVKIGIDGHPRRTAMLNFGGHCEFPLSLGCNEVLTVALARGRQCISALG